MTDHLMIRQFIVGLCLLFLSGCDGGIFGTGDGEDPTVVVPGDTTEDGQMGTPVTGDMNQPPDGVSLSVVTANTTGSFNNSEITNSGNNAQVKLLNASPDETLSLVAINNNMIEAPLLPLPGITTTARDSGYITLSNPANAIALFTASDVAGNDFSRPVVSFDPITLAAGSTTSLIVRGIPGNTMTPLELLAVGNQTSTVDNQALVRVVHAATSIDNAIDIILKPDAAIEREEINVGAGFGYPNGITDYLTTVAGTYDLVIRDTDDPDRVLLGPESIVLAANEVLTLIVLDTDSTGEEGVTVLRTRDSGL